MQSYVDDVERRYQHCYYRSYVNHYALDDCLQVLRYHDAQALQNDCHHVVLQCGFHNVHLTHGYHHHDLHQGGYHGCHHDCRRGYHYAVR